MREIWLTAKNYNWLTNKNKLHNSTATKTISCLNLVCEYSICALAKIAKGAVVNNNKSLLLFAESTKTKTPIKKEATIFLYDNCSIDGRWDKVMNIEKTKNNATET
jgi:hypothetical protein